MDVGYEKVGHLQCLSGSALGPGHSNAKGSLLKHQAVIAPIADAHAVIRTQALHMGSLGFGLALGVQHGEIHRKALELGSGAAMGVAGDHMDGKGPGQSLNPGSHTIQKPTILGQGAIEIQHQMLQMQGVETRDLDGQHGISFILGPFIGKRIKSVPPSPRSGHRQ
jgi:hypothetical protein